MPATTIAYLHNATFALRFRSPMIIRSGDILQSQKPLRMSFSGSFRSLKLPNLGMKLVVKRNNRGGGVRMEITAAQSYAQALAESSRAIGTLEATSADLQKIDEIFSEAHVFRFFSSPVIEMEKKHEIVDFICSSMNFQPFTSNFLNILVDMRRTDVIRDIVKDFEIVYNIMTDTELAIVTSVVPPEPHHLAQIAKELQKITGAKNVRIKTAIDPSLIAGLTIRFGKSCSNMIDLSVKKQLEDLQASQLGIEDVNLAPASAIFD